MLHTGHSTATHIMTMFGVFLMVLCFLGAGGIARALHSPFSYNLDSFNIDALIAGTEQTLFSYLRASFDDRHGLPAEEGLSTARLVPQQRGMPSSAPARQ